MPDPTIAILSQIDAGAGSGARARRVRALVAAFGKDVLLFQPGGRLPGCETRTLPWDLGRAPFPRRWSRLNFRVPANRRRVGELLGVIRPGLVILTSIWDFAAVRDLAGVPVVLDARRVESERENPSGLRARSGPVEREERRVLERVRHVFTHTAEDQLSFRERFGLPSDRVSLVPDGVAIENPDDEPPPPPPLPSRWNRRLRGRALLWYRAEEEDRGAGESLVFLNRVLLPELERRHPGRFVLVVQGARPRGFKPRPDLWFCPGGALAERLFPRTVIGLAPALHHPADRMSVLELVASGKPVVATPRAVRDIACANGVHAAVEEAESFADAVCRLADQPGAAGAMARGGRAFVRAMYDWRSIQSRWQVVARRLMQENAPP